MKKLDELLTFAPKKWQNEYQQAIEALLPVDGRAQDRHGVVHGIIGNFTECDRQWAGPASQYACDVSFKGWNVMPKDAAVTCFWCLEGIPHWT